MQEPKTLNYYDEKTQEFIESTVNVDFKETQDKFLQLLEPKTHILDFGCGSGRDTKYFLEQGFIVTAIDGSAELCKFASALTGIEVKQMFFQELSGLLIKQAEMVEPFSGFRKQLRFSSLFS